MADVARQAFILLVVSLASYRAWRLIAVDDITEPLRDPLANSDRDWVLKVHDGITCPWCLGSWVAFAAVAIAAQLVDVWLPVAQALAAAALVGWLAERVG